MLVSILEYSETVVVGPVNLGTIGDVHQLRRGIGKICIPREHWKNQ